VRLIFRVGGYVSAIVVDAEAHMRCGSNPHAARVSHRPVLVRSACAKWSTL
jgi:hypothetical protein